MKKETRVDSNSFFRSITFRIIIIVAVISLFFGTVGTIFATSKAKKQLTEQIQKQQLALADYIANDIEMEVRKSLRFLTHLAYELPQNYLETDTGLITKWLEEKHIPPVFPYGMVLISPDGKELIAEYPVLPEREKHSFVEDEWFQRAKVADQAILSQPFKNKMTQEPSIMFAVPIRNDQNDVVAVAAGLVELNQSEFFNYLQTSRKKDSDEILVISPKDQLFISSNRPERVLQPTPAPGINRLHDMAMNGYRGVGISVNADGVEDLAAISDIETTGWFVVVRQPSREAYLPMHQLAKSLVIYNVLSAMFGVLIMIIALVIMLSPLKKAALLVKEMASGNLPLEKISVARKDEIGDLMEGFNSLVDAIDERTDELEIANRKLADLSMTDELTGLGNRRYFNEKLEQEWSRASRTQQPLALGMIDLDWFKKYNDHYGHQRGDECLKKVSDLLASTLGRPGDFVARYGGEEIAFIAPVCNAEGARMIAEKFLENLQALALPHLASELGFVSASIGVAVMTPVNGEESTSLIKSADEALYLAKKQGRNRVVLSSYEPSDDPRSGKQSKKRTFLKVPDSA